MHGYSCRGVILFNSVRYLKMPEKLIIPGDKEGKSFCTFDLTQMLTDLSCGDDIRQRSSLDALRLIIEIAGRPYSNLDPRIISFSWTHHPLRGWGSETGIALAWVP